jgi:hypothetical protein
VATLHDTACPIPAIFTIYVNNFQVPLRFPEVPYSDSGFDEAIELARAGNSYARHHLARLVRRVPDSPEGRRADQLLREIDKHD